MDQKDNLLITSIRSNNIDRVRELLADGANPHIFLGMPYLIAAKYKLYDIVDLLCPLMDESVQREGIMLLTDQGKIDEISKVVKHCNTNTAVLALSVARSYSHTVQNLQKIVDERVKSEQQKQKLMGSISNSKKSNESNVGEKRRI